MWASGQTMVCLICTVLRISNWFRLAGNQISATTLQRFISENGDVSNGITIGLGGGYLTGCSVLAIVSSRAVYMVGQ